MTEVKAGPTRSGRPSERLLWSAVLLVISVTPLIVDLAGRDVFRLPKAAFFQATMLAIGAIAASAMLLLDGFAHSVLSHRTPIVFATAGVAWVSIVSVTAVVPEASHAAPLSIFCHAILFLLTVALARNQGLVPAVAALLAPAIVNATIIHLQAFSIWQPFNTVHGTRLGNVGLIGNPNTAGTYLLVPTVAALAFTVAVRRYRVVSAAVALLLLSAIFQVQTITVGLGMTSALIAFLVRASGRVRLAASAILITGVIAIAAYAPARERARLLTAAARRGEYARLTSWRIPAAATALAMFRDRPLLGVGPGGFAARYMPYRLRVEERNPQWIQDVRENFGEAHNDHAQILAETGLPGYLLFLSLLAFIARRTFQAHTDTDTRSRFIRVFAFPAVAGFAVMTLGQFPLELAAASSTAVYAAALCFAWSPDAIR